ncbi:zinc finger BED domain-containing protein 4-like [Anopheles merus]|uniref:zinc finger BED domain-containing protein 4-like n=1 Tax=Anopheles merus TaxID=30066 RepID=UPI001BE4CE3A|nr:zinc finger BED domain-containing protein 4-like [Anopheles merus]
MLNPKYEVPSRKTLSNGLLESNYQRELAKLTDNLSKTTSLALTSDGWTNSNNTSFMAVTVHYINDESNLCSNLLECTEFPNKHTADNIAICLKNVAEKFKIHDKIQAVVTDNAANMKAGVRQTKFTHLPCFAHTLNLIVQNAVQKSISDTVEKIKTIVRFFKKNSTATHKLAEAQQKLGFIVLKLKQDVLTRWNSTYDMINRFHKNKIPILSCLDSMKYKHDLSTKDWLVMEQTVKVLQTFDHVTKVISAEKSVTISKMGILLNILRQKIGKEMSDELEPPVKKLISILIQGLLEKGKPYLENKLVNQAMLLDPRMKNHSFENDRDSDSMGTEMSNQREKIYLNSWTNLKRII